MENESLPGPTREKSVQESGYSEAEQAKVIEGTQVDLRQLKKRKPAAPILTNRQDKILVAYQNSHDQMKMLLVSLNANADNPRHHEKILEEIKSLKELQDELLQCLLLEHRGELSQITASNRAWNLIK